MFGNVEPRDSFQGEVDSLVCDGFTGNVLLKSVEGIGRFIKKALLHSMTKNPLRAIGAVPSLPAIKEFKNVADYRVYGGAPFLGVKKPVLKAHGSSDELVFYYTLKQAEEFVNGKAIEKMTNDVAKLSVNINNENNANND